jgi:hypothetical protein
LEYAIATGAVASGLGLLFFELFIGYFSAGLLSDLYQTRPLETGTVTGFIDLFQQAEREFA